MTDQEIRALAVGFGPVIREHVRDEIGRAAAALIEEIVTLKAELGELRAKLTFEDRAKA
jgi:hypothetical protein